MRNLVLTLKTVTATVVLAHFSVAESVLAENHPKLIQSLGDNLCQTCEVSAEIPNFRDRPLVLAEAFPLTQQLERSNATRRFLSEALEVANRIEAPEVKARVLSEIALKYAAIGDRNRAVELLDLALTAAQTIEDIRERSRAFNAIAIDYVELGEGEIATALLADAVAAADRIEDPTVKANLLTEIALNYDAIGDRDRSLALLSQSREIARTPALSPTEALFPFQPTDWQGRIGLAATLFSGAKTTSIATLSAGIERQWPTDEFDVNLSLTNDFDDTRVAPVAQNQFKGQLDAEYRHHTTARYQYFVSSLVRRDELDNIDLRTNLYAGPGVNLWRAGSDRTLDMQLGLGARYEDSNRRSEDVDFPVAQYRLRYKDIYFDRLNLRQFLTVEIPVGDVEDYYVESSTTLGIPVVAGWSFNNSLILRYSGQPTLENPNLRVDFTTGIEYAF